MLSTGHHPRHEKSSGGNRAQVGDHTHHRGHRLQNKVCRIQGLRKGKNLRGQGWEFSVSKIECEVLKVSYHVPKGVMSQMPRCKLIPLNVDG